MTQHPTLETLSGYILSPQDQEYLELRRHLLGCEHCRQRTDRLSALTQKIHHDVPHYRYIDNAADEDVVTQSYTGQQLTDEQRQTLKQSPSTMKAVLHSLTHSAAMQSALQKDTSIRVATQAPTSHPNSGLILSLTQWWQQLFNWHTPTWITIPVTATLVFVLTITLAPNFSQQRSQPVVTAYQDSPVITFQAAGTQRPGIGFFSNTPSTTRPFSPVHITLHSDNSLTLSWPAVKDASSYTISIAEIDGESTNKLFQKTTSQSQVQFMTFSYHSGHRYTWTISGNTRNGEQFQTQGGFVVQ